MQTFITIILSTWIYCKKYRKKSYNKIKTMFKTHMIDRWWKEDVTLHNFYAQISAFHYKKEAYFDELTQEIQKDKIIMENVNTILTMAGIMENNEVICEAKQRQLYKESLKKLIVAAAFIVTLFTGIIAIQGHMQ